MFASTVTVFVLILFQADGSRSYIPGWHTFRSCETGLQVVLTASENLYTAASPKRAIAGYCVAQFGTGEESAP